MRRLFTNAAPPVNGDDANFLIGFANAGTHEVAGDILRHVGDNATSAGSNLMNGTSDRESSLLFDSDLSFEPHQSNALRRKLNDDGDYPLALPPPSPLPAKVAQ